MISVKKFRLDKNNETVQQGNTKDLIFTFEDIITYVSQFFKLNMGDLIYTGTPAGVGSVKIGDKLEGFIYQNGKESGSSMFSCEIR